MNSNQPTTFTTIRDMIGHAQKTGKINTSEARTLNFYCYAGMPAVAAAELKKVQPYTIDEKKNVYQLVNQ